MANFNASRTNAQEVKATSQQRLSIEHGKFSFTPTTDIEVKKPRKAKPSSTKQSKDKMLGNATQMFEGGESSTVQDHDDQHQCCQHAEVWRKKFIDLESRFSAMEKEIASMKGYRENREVRSHFQHLYKAEAKQVNENKQVQYRLDVLTNTVVRLDEKLKEANDKLLFMQARSMRKNLIISGLEESENETKEQLLEKIEVFLKEKLKYPDHVPLKTYHRLGYVDGAGYRPTIIKLLDMDQKSVLLALAPGLKGLKNAKQKFYYFSEQLPDQLHEERKYAQYWLADNKRKPENQQKNLKIYKNRLHIDSRPYHRKITPPSAAKILKVDLDELCQVKQSPTIFGDSREEQGSEFISYAVQVKSQEEVRMAYRKLRIKYADATHIVSAYRLSPLNGPLNQEANDDGEYGGGRCLMNCLHQARIVNAAVFIVRYYGGKRIGSLRFTIMEDLVKTALLKANLTPTPKRGPQTRSRTRQASQGVPRRYQFSPPIVAAKATEIPSRPSSVEPTSEQETEEEATNTAEEEYASLVGSNSQGEQATTDEDDDEEPSQVVLNYQRDHASLSFNPQDPHDDVDNDADNEEEEVQETGKNTS